MHDRVPCPALYRRHAGLEARLRQYFGDAPLSAAHLKLADAPAEAVAIDYEAPDGSTSAFPLVRVRNVYVLPGACALARS